MADEGESVGADTSSKALTKEEQKRVDEAFALERRLKYSVAVGWAAWWETAKVTHEMHEKKSWELLGHDTLEEFLAQPDLGMSRRWFFKMSQTYRDLAGVRQIEIDRLKQIEPTKAMEVRPAIMSGDVNAEQALSDAESLSFRDLAEKYRPSKRNLTGQDPSNSKLDADAEPERVRCPCCRQWTTEAEIPAKYRKEI